MGERSLRHGEALRMHRKNRGEGKKLLPCLKGRGVERHGGRGEELSSLLQLWERRGGRHGQGGSVQSCCAREKKTGTRKWRLGGR
jgi:hypothetical protein